MFLPVGISCCFDSLDLTLAHPCGARRAVALLSKTPTSLRRFWFVSSTSHTLAHPCGARRAVALLSKTPPNLRRFCVFGG